MESLKNINYQHRQAVQTTVRGALLSWGRALIKGSGIIVAPRSRSRSPGRRRPWVGAGQALGQLLGLIPT